MGFKRRRAPRGDRRRFTRSAMRTNRRNMIGPMRGGIRL